MKMGRRVEDPEVGAHLSMMVSVPNDKPAAPLDVVVVVKVIEDGGGYVLSCTCDRLSRRANAHYSMNNLCYMSESVIPLSGVGNRYT